MTSSAASERGEACGVARLKQAAAAGFSEVMPSVGPWQLYQSRKLRLHAVGLCRSCIKPAGGNVKQTDVFLSDGFVAEFVRIMTSV